ncbi:hypothetical protein ACGFW5_27295 [Streptomyces sp. NPDC048416]|uniref:hypothetical protein n=1 Tax=Streptomyces sp. NPDC048416 TaxID=3365546 RepID=UPI0037127A11
MPAPTRHTSASPRTRIAAVAALTLAGTALTTLAAAPAAFAAPGDNGDIKVHAVGTPFTDPRDEPKVCNFYLDAFAFDAAPGTAWNVNTEPIRAGGPSLSNTIQLVSGAGHTPPLTLPNGQYKLSWNVVGGTGPGKQKIFTVECPVSAQRAAIGPHNGPPHIRPHGGVAAGGGGLAESPSIPQAGAVAGVGLVAVAGVLYVRRLRRRPHGEA